MDLWDYMIWLVSKNPACKGCYDCMVFWCPMVSISLMAEEHMSICFVKSVKFFVVYVCFYTTNISNSLVSPGLVGPSNRTTCTAAWTCCRAVPHLGLTQRWQLAILIRKWAGLILPRVEYAASRTKEVIGFISHTLESMCPIRASCVLTMFCSSLF